MRIFLVSTLLAVLTVTHLTVMAANKHLTRSGAVDTQSASAPPARKAPAGKASASQHPHASQPGRATSV
ncbi:hypothetical protein [Amantichitinum ursilacus]|uniref:Uncharacterized protein n=1 Tax=Amantichitinum ursilacus TaxID=857265 RepID=A0A0N0GQ48_9NEIS|nr:hypothetical protein [Amantichitinum ursilacus]KPC54292.1 hypothetical protein WG78_06570 [Amantichitinum ursilacus]